MRIWDLRANEVVRQLWGISLDGGDQLDIVVRTVARNTSDGRGVRRNLCVIFRGWRMAISGCSLEMSTLRRVPVVSKFGLEYTVDDDLARLAWLSRLRPTSTLVIVTLPNTAVRLLLTSTASTFLPGRRCQNQVGNVLTGELRRILPLQQVTRSGKCL